MNPPAGDGTISALRGTLIFCRDDPFLTDPGKAFVSEPDGLVICRDGMIQAVGPYAALKAELPPNADVADHSGCLIAPGFIETPMTAPITAEMKQQFISLTPIGRFGEPRDIAAAALYLASDDSRFMVGQIISPNGGFVI